MVCRRQSQADAIRRQINSEILPERDSKYDRSAQHEAVYPMAHQAEGQTSSSSHTREANDAMVAE